MKRTNGDAAATRRSAIMMAVIGHCGKTLTPSVVDQMIQDILQTVEAGSMSWAFRFSELESANEAERPA